MILTRFSDHKMQTRLCWNIVQETGLPGEQPFMMLPTPKMATLQICAIIITPHECIGRWIDKVKDNNLLGLLRTLLCLF